ncbi:hypothetical protein C4571_02210 [Candidatus Parcubacteria bacterium]|nr:MAG: hypothetical protein C4571_02210 [Candidatus Parcubacteria bacterium]
MSDTALFAFNKKDFYILGRVRERQALAAGTVDDLSYDDTTGRIKFCLLDLTCVAEIDESGNLYIPGRVREREVFANRNSTDGIRAEASAVVLNIGITSVVEFTVTAMRIKGRLYEHTLGAALLAGV